MFPCSTKWLPGALDGLLHLRIGRVHQLANLTADVLLPAGQRLEISVNARVGRVCHGESGLSTLGAGGCAVSALGLGTMTFGVGD